MQRLILVLGRVRLFQSARDEVETLSGAVFSSRPCFNRPATTSA